MRKLFQIAFATALALAPSATRGDDAEEVLKAARKHEKVLSIHPGLPRLKLLSTVEEWSNSCFRISSVELAWEGGGKPFQKVEPSAASHFFDDSCVRTDDLNFDGFQDLMVMSNSGATGNASYNVFFFDPEKYLFIHRPEFENLSCPEAFPEEREIRTFEKGGDAGWVHTAETWKYDSAGKLRLVKKVEQASVEPGKTYKRVTTTFENGREASKKEELVPCPGDTQSP